MNTTGFAHTSKDIVLASASKRSNVPMPRQKRTDPPSPRIPTDPRTWPAEKRAFGFADRKYFPSPQSPWGFEHGLDPSIVAACVVREVMLALDLSRFPEKRWTDWLTRRALALYRVERQFRERMDGPSEREHCYSYMRHWLYVGLRSNGWKFAALLPDEMSAGHPPTRKSVSSRKQGPCSDGG